MVNIRIATTKDAAQIAKMIEVLARKFITPEFTAEATDHFLNANNEASILQFMQQGFIYFVAEDMTPNTLTVMTEPQSQYESELIGCIGMRDNSHLYHLFIAEAWQGRGLSRKLWQQAKQDCAAKGNPGCYTVNASNNAVEVYQRFGFVRTSPVQQMHGVWFNPMQLSDDYPAD